MYDAGKVITGIIIFIAVLSIPIWYNRVSGKVSFKPELKYVKEDIMKVSDDMKCVESREYMRENHMQLVNDWRDKVVRDGAKRVHITSDKSPGRKKHEYEISLTNTCLKCHSNKKDYCDKCHDYLMVSPKCWDCHVIPEEKKL